MNDRTSTKYSTRYRCWPSKTAYTNQIAIELLHIAEKLDMLKHHNGKPSSKTQLWENTVRQIPDFIKQVGRKKKNKKN
jgi:hypothetical protein